MKEQYVGDISDYRKYALLRALAAGGAIRIGIAWMLTPSDGSADGNKLAYLGRPEKHRHFDPELFDMLAHVATEPDRRRLQSIEDGGAVPGAGYFNEVLSDNAAGRRAYMNECLAAFVDVDLVFFDPDNGLEVRSVRLGNKRSSKYLFLDEVLAFHAAGKSMLIYQHFPRVSKDVFVASCVAKLRDLAPDATIGTYQTAHVVFLLLIHPDADEQLHAVAKATASRWDASFIAGRLYEADEALPTTSAAQTEAVKAAVDADAADER